MSKQINFTYDSTNFTLEFNRAAVRRMEANGFVIGEITDKPMTMIPKLVAGAFYMHHPTVSAERVNEIYDAIPNKSEFLKKLGELYEEPMETLMDDPKDKSKKVNWTVNW